MDGAVEYEREKGRRKRGRASTESAGGIGADSVRAVSRKPEQYVV